MNRRTATLAAIGALALLVSPSRAQEESLSIGDPAPPLAVGKFVKGEPISGFEDNKTYVVEFWATWCGPCRASIPHLTELAKQYEEVPFIGVSIWEEADPVPAFVEEMGDQMDYRVAVDKVEDDARPDRGTMARTWMTAAGENGIPTAFIIDDGKVAWIGHPMSMDEPLAKVVSGEWDLQAAAEQRRQETQLQQVLAGISRAMRDGSFEDALSRIEAARAEHPQLSGTLDSMEFQCVAAMGDERAVEVAEAIVGEDEGPSSLNNIAWFLITPERDVEPGERAIRYARQLIERACEQEPDNYVFLDTLAKAQFLSGDRAEAVRTQRRAIELMEKEGLPDGHPIRSELTDRLKQYEKARPDEGGR